VTRILTRIFIKELGVVGLGVRLQRVVSGRR
jgi:hypothetical protein